MKNKNFWLWVTIFVTTLSILMALPRFEINIDREIGPLPVKMQGSYGDYDIDFSVFGFRFQRDLRFAPGLDLQGGVHVVLEADMTDVPEDSHRDALNSAKQVIERRVDFLGVTEPNIYTSVKGDKYRIIVELPGVTDSEEIINIIGETAQLDFREEYIPPETEDEPDETAENQAAETDPWQKTGLTGSYLKRAQVVFDSTSGQPLVQITFNDEGADLFEEITRRNIDKRLAIFLDNRPITAPVVQQAISGGEATISGQFTLEDAKNLVVQLNAGALPAPVSIVQQQNIGPSLGRETINNSIYAGLAGLGLIALFMLINYRLLGVFAITSLLIYGAITIAVYKFIPVTLTLSGITGFILSFGLAVDSNILIFERIREEIRSGKTIKSALNLGFTRAWDSIRDANTATIITVLILLNPLNWSFLVTSGTVRGFAVTLGIGVLISLFTGVIVTRTLIYHFYPKSNQSNKST